MASMSSLIEAGLVKEVRRRANNNMIKSQKKESLPPVILLVEESLIYLNAKAEAGRQGEFKNH